MKIANIEVTLIDSCGTDLSVVNAARVSMDKESGWNEEWILDDPLDDGLVVVKSLKESDIKLIKYLAEHKHFSPFNHTFLSFRIKAPIFVARQLVKHKFLPWNEVSRRYVDSEPEFYIPEGLRKRAENIKQGSLSELVEPLEIGEGIYYHPEEAIHENTVYCLNKYNTLLNIGTCAEQARMVLPLNTMTDWYWSGTLGAWLDMLVLRLDDHTQKETRDVAELVAKEVKQLFPESYKARIG